MSFFKYRLYVIWIRHQRRPVVTQSQKSKNLVSWFLRLRVSCNSHAFEKAYFRLLIFLTQPLYLSHRSDIVSKPFNYSSSDEIVQSTSCELHITVTSEATAISWMIHTLSQYGLYLANSLLYAWPFWHVYHNQRLSVVSWLSRVGITAAWTVKPCPADRSGNYGQLELSFSWSCTGWQYWHAIVATLSVDKYRPKVCNIASFSSNSSIQSILCCAYITTLLWFSSFRSPSLTWSPASYSRILHQAKRSLVQLWSRFVSCCEPECYVPVDHPGWYKQHQPKYG